MFALVIILKAGITLGFYDTQFLCEKAMQRFDENQVTALCINTGEIPI
jgi:hypothetical protein